MADDDGSIQPVSASGGATAAANVAPPPTPASGGVTPASPAGPAVGDTAGVAGPERSSSAGQQSRTNSVKGMIGGMGPTAEEGGGARRTQRTPTPASPAAPD